MFVFNTERVDKYLKRTEDTFSFCTIHIHLTGDKGNLIYLLFLFSSFFPFFSSPPRTPVKVVPRIRIELEPEDNDYFWRSKGTETTL